MARPHQSAACTGAALRGGLRGAAMLAGLCLAVQSAGAQTTSFDEAVRQNIALGMDICLRGYLDPPGLLTSFAAAGFVRSDEDLGAGNVIHWFEAPADTVQVAVVPLEFGAVDCRITTTHMGVGAALAFAGAVLESRHPGVFTYGEVEGSAPIVTPADPGQQRGPCTGFSGLLPRVMAVVRAANAGNDPGCVEDGTSQILMGF